MFMGEYRHTIDAKGRLIVPAKFREQLGDSFVVTRGMDGCLFGYTQEEWNILETKLQNYHLQRKTPVLSFVFSIQLQLNVKLISRVE